MDQGYFNGEILKVNDESNQAIKVIIRIIDLNQYNHHENAGVKIGRKKAIITGRGEFILTLVSDHYFWESFLVSREIHNYV